MVSDVSLCSAADTFGIDEGKGVDYVLRLPTRPLDQKPDNIRQSAVIPTTLRPSFPVFILAGLLPFQVVISMRHN